MVPPYRKVSWGEGRGAYVYKWSSSPEKKESIFDVFGVISAN